MTDSLIEMTTEIVSSYVIGNKVASTDLPAVYTSLVLTETPEPETEPKPTHKLTPNQIRKSVTGTGIVSFEDGKTYQTLKRHLATYGLTVDEYKAKWGLPKDYPTTAPAYSATRSALAKSLGLGRKGRFAKNAATAAGKKPRAKKATA